MPTLSTTHAWRPHTVGARLSRGTASWAVVALLLAGAQRAAAQPPSAPSDQHYRAARAAFGAGNLEQANLEVRLALQDNPNDPASHFLLASLLERKGETDQAIVGFQQALALDPTNPGTLYNLGTLLLRRGEVADASNLLEKAVWIRPGHVPTYENLGKAYFVAGLPDLAVTAYEEALRRDPANVGALKNLLMMAEASGYQDAADSYRRRLQVVTSGRRGATNPRASGPAWPAADPAGKTLPWSPAQDDGASMKPHASRDADVEAMRELVRDLPSVSVERRGGQVTLLGWTRSAQEHEMLGRILAGRKDVLDLTTGDVGDSARMLELDAVIFTHRRIEQSSVGFNLLDLIKANFSYFATDNKTAGTGYVSPGTFGAVTGAFQSGWAFSASVDYLLNIANAATEHVAVLARPHLTTLSGTPASFLAGGEIVFKVSGINSGDIKPYPFGTTLKVTPTLLRTVSEDGSPRVHVVVEAGRTSALDLLDVKPVTDTVTFDKVAVTSQTVVGLGQTLILSGLDQREARNGRSGVPGLMHVPGLKYLFSTKTKISSDSAVIILLTPRDPAYMDKRNREALAAFVEKRRAFMVARQGSAEDMRRFKEQYPDWEQIAPNRFAAHFFLMNSSDLYRSVSGQDVVSEDLELDILGMPPTKKKTP